MSFVSQFLLKAQLEVCTTVRQSTPKAPVTYGSTGAFGTHSSTVDVISHFLLEGQLEVCAITYIILNR